ncbi:hypothetical protein AGMMS49928_20670 [Spirochaetia bacterium]|nr:hypothetical protein AGMMS49928_20670 [Spirochaetia bacterium]
MFEELAKRYKHERWEVRRLGREKGRAGEKLEIARKLKARGRPLAEIVEDTGLTPEAIEKL